MIKLIVTDIDGTLLPEGTNEINPEIFSLIRNLKDQGIHFVVASGRHKSCIDKMFEPVKNDIFYITSNGAYIGTYSKKMTVSDFTPEILQQLFDDFDKPNDPGPLLIIPNHLPYCSHRSPYGLQ